MTLYSEINIFLVVLFIWWCRVCVQRRQISLGIRPVWSESSLCAQWVSKDPRFLHADSDDWAEWADAQADLRWAPFYWHFLTAGPTVTGFRQNDSCFAWSKFRGMGLFLVHPIGRQPDMTEILMTASLNLNLNKETNISRVERKTMVTQTYFWNPCLVATWTPL